MVLEGGILPPLQADLRGGACAPGAPCPATLLESQGFNPKPQVDFPSLEFWYVHQE